MRVLVTSICEADWVCAPLAQQPGFEVAAFHPRYVRLGEWGVSRVDASQPRSYLVRTSAVFPTRPYTASLYLGGLKRLLREFAPDVLYHLGEPSELGTWQVIRMARKVSPRTRIVVYSLENLVRQWHGFPRCLRGLAERATIPRIDRVVGCSVSVVRAWERQGFDPAHLSLNYVPINTQLFVRRDASELRTRLASPGEFLVGYVGRLVAEKGLDLLLRALASLPERFVVALAGTGRAELELRALAGELQLEHRVRWLGKVESEDMPRYMSAFDVLVLPSRGIPVWQEQFGRVLPEAMLCGTPVVGSSSGAIPDVIGEAGLIFPENDHVALAQCLRKLGTDEALRQQCIERGLQRAQQEFTPEVMVRRLVAVLQEAAH